MRSFERLKERSRTRTTSSDQSLLDNASSTSLPLEAPSSTFNAVNGSYARNGLGLADDGASTSLANASPHLYAKRDLETPTREAFGTTGYPLPSVFATPEAGRPSIDSFATAPNNSPMAERERRPSAVETLLREQQERANRQAGPVARVAEPAAAESAENRPRASSAPLVPSPKLTGNPTMGPAPNATPSSESRTRKPVKLTPEHLAHVDVRVVHSHIKVNERNREVISFTIAVLFETPRDGPTAADSSSSQSSAPTSSRRRYQWVIEKKYSDVLALDTVVKGKHNRTQNKRIAPLPDKSLFKDHAPAKVDLRKVG